MLVSQSFSILLICCGSLASWSQSQPKDFRGKAWFKPGQYANLSRDNHQHSNSHRWDSFELPVDLICVYLGCGRKPEYPEETRMENMQTPHRKEPYEWSRHSTLLRGVSATHCTSMLPDLWITSALSCHLRNLSWCIEAKCFSWDLHNKIQKKSSNPKYPYNDHYLLVEGTSLIHSPARTETGTRTWQSKCQAEQ